MKFGDRIVVYKEIEVEIGPEDLDEYFREFLHSEGVLSELIELGEAIEVLHDEHHTGSIWLCPHPACYSSFDALKAMRRVQERHEHPSLAALHVQAAKLREAEKRDTGTAGEQP